MFPASHCEIRKFTTGLKVGGFYRGQMLINTHNTPTRTYCKCSKCWSPDKNLFVIVYEGGSAVWISSFLQMEVSGFGPS